MILAALVRPRVLGILNYPEAQQLLEYLKPLQHLRTLVVLMVPKVRGRLCYL